MEPSPEPSIGVSVQTPVRHFPAVHGERAGVGVTDTCEERACPSRGAKWARLPLGLGLTFGAAAGCWSFSPSPGLESWARVHPTLPAHRRPPDQTAPPPPHPLHLLRGEGPPASFLVNKQPCRQPCLASQPHTEELGIGTV